jgi:hypothetical protein
METKQRISRAKGRRVLLDILVEPRQILSDVITHRSWIVVSGMMALYVLAAMFTTVLLLQDGGLVSDYLDSMMKKRPASISVERLQAARDRTRAALEMPGMSLLLGVRVGVSRTLRLCAFWIVLGTGGILTSQSWGSFPRVVLGAAASVPILTLGSLINGLSRMAFHDLNAVASLGGLLSPCGTNSLGCFALTNVDVFVLWYLGVVSIGCAVALHSTTTKALMLVVPTWALVVVCSFLTDAGAGWTL